MLAVISDEAVNKRVPLALSLALVIVPGSGGVQAQESHMEFVPIAPGEFQMGCAPGDLSNLPDGTYSLCPNAAKPPHRVRITKPFEIGKYEVTQPQWQAVMGVNPSYFQGQTLPVEQITWDEIHEFLARLNAGNDGYRYRLPTEAEWEYCARAGPDRQFGASPLRDSAWFGADGGKLPVTETPGGTHPVGTKLPNAWGIYDMLGNVAEWVEDWYSDTYYKSSPATDPIGPSTGQLHVARGGSWFSNASLLRVWNRYITVQVLKRRDVGFRCVRESSRPLPGVPRS
jgi:formylglycine-generating enzyme required for sulfatase activity